MTQIGHNLELDMGQWIAVRDALVLARTIHTARLATGTVEIPCLVQAKIDEIDSVLREHCPYALAEPTGDPALDKLALEARARIAANAIEDAEFGLNELNRIRRRRSAIVRRVPSRFDRGRL